MKKTSSEKNSHSNGEKDSQEHEFPAGLSNLQAFTCSFSHQRAYTHRPCPRDRHLDCIKLPGGMCAKLQYEIVIKKAACLLFLWFPQKGHCLRCFHLMRMCLYSCFCLIVSFMYVTPPQYHCLSSYCEVSCCSSSCHVTG